MDKNVPETTLQLPGSSLQELSIIKIVTSLYNNPSLLHSILSCCFCKDTMHRSRLRKSKGWKAVLAKANQLISQLPILLRKKMLGFLYKAAVRIKVWECVYARGIRNVYLQCFYWTGQGQIDTWKTATDIVRNKNCPLRRRFVLGCKACLEEELQDLWAEMSQADKEYFLSGNDEESRPLLVFFAHKLAGLSDHLNEYYDDALKYAVGRGLFEAVHSILPGYRDYFTHDYMKILVAKFEKQHHLEEGEIKIAHFLFYKLVQDETEIYFNDYPRFTFFIILYSFDYELCFTFVEQRLESASAHDWYGYIALPFYKYYLEFSDDDACAKLFMKICRLVPSAVKNYLASTHQFFLLPTLLIRDYFPFVLEKNGLKEVAKITSLGLNSLTYAKPFDFGRWEILQFIVNEELTAIPLLKDIRKTVLLMLNKRRSNRAAWLRLLGLMRYIQKKNDKGMKKT